MFCQYWFTKSLTFLCYKIFSMEYYNCVSWPFFLIWSDIFQNKKYKQSQINSYRVLFINLQTAFSISNLRPSTKVQSRIINTDKFQLIDIEWNSWKKRQQKHPCMQVHVCSAQSSYFLSWLKHHLWYELIALYYSMVTISTKLELSVTMLCKFWYYMHDSYQLLFL